MRTYISEPNIVYIIIKTRRIRLEKEMALHRMGQHGLVRTEDTDWVGRKRIGLRKGSGTQVSYSWD